jgi:hypothetical protein
VLFALAIADLGCGEPAATGSAGSSAGAAGAAWIAEAEGPPRALSLEWSEGHRFALRSTEHLVQRSGGADGPATVQVSQRSATLEVARHEGDDDLVLAVRSADMDVHPLPGDWSEKLEALALVATFDVSTDASGVVVALRDEPPRSAVGNALHLGLALGLLLPGTPAGEVQIGQTWKTSNRLRAGADLEVVVTAEQDLRFAGMAPCDPKVPEKLCPALSGTVSVTLTGPGGESAEWTTRAEGSGTLFVRMDQTGKTVDEALLELKIDASIQGEGTEEGRTAISQARTLIATLTREREGR